MLLAFNDNLDATKRTALRPSVRTCLGLRVLHAFNDILDATKRTALRLSARSSFSFASVTRNNDPLGATKRAAMRPSVRTSLGLRVLLACAVGRNQKCNPIEGENLDVTVNCSKAS